jgi:2-amino-4-hydroxy-6-hydroxymethyldihydropteridine diphosphokinase
MPSRALPYRIFLSLGSNLANRRLHLRTAVLSLEPAGISVVSRSSIYETEPVDVTEQPDFLNLVCEVRTRLRPRALLAMCLQLESRLGRIRTNSRGPRTVDIDILFYGDEVIEEPELSIPHPRLYSRNFVLVPLAEIAPGFRDPRSGLTVSELLAKSPDKSRVQIAEA